MWYDLTEDKIQSDPMLSQERYCAYHNTFMSTSHGRAVLFDLMKNAHQFEDVPLTPENAQMFLVLTRFIRDIKIKCGLTDPMAVLEAEAKLSEDYRPEDKPKEKNGVYDD